MKRRDFLKYGSYSITALAIGAGVAIPKIFKAPVLNAQESAGILKIEIKKVMAEMVDRSLVPMWCFADQIHGPHIPGTTIFTTEGERINLEIINRNDEPHAFAIPGVVRSRDLPPGDSTIVSFDAPPAGTYMYLDPVNAPVNRVMGLHGTMVVQPASVFNTPYSNPTNQVQRLFDALGSDGTMPDAFPGDPWDPERTRVWLINTIDPRKNELVAGLPPGEVISASDFLDGYLPEYFTISGKTGYFASHSPEIFPHGNVGQPLLLRVLNAGLANHSPHIHGNHVYLLSENGVVSDNLIFLDTWTMEPGSVKDLLLPFSPPPDAHPWPPSEIRQFPMSFPMHCHMEQSQTAAGGNYPQGLVTDWELTSPQVGGPEPSREEFPFFRGMDPGLFK